MKTNKILYLLFAYFLFTACDAWEPNVPKDDNSLREELEGAWNIKTYILPSGKQEFIQGNHSLDFGQIQNDTCDITLKYVNLLHSKCVIGAKNQIEILDGWGGTEIYDLSGNEDKFINVLNSINNGFVRNDSLFLLTDSSKQSKYKAICLTK